MKQIIFENIIVEINNHKIIKLPKENSDQLPSRGMVMIEGTLNQIVFQAALEPDGLGSHWFELDEQLIDDAALSTGSLVKLEISVLDNWYEPIVPKDLEVALKTSELLDVWDGLTVKARWEWVRWIRFTKNPDTRSKRIEVTCSKLEAGKKRPCCFDLTRCTVTEVSNNGVLK